MSNKYILAYDIPLSALVYIIWAGIPVEEYIYNKAKPIYNKGPNGEEFEEIPIFEEMDIFDNEDSIEDMKYIRLYEDEDDGL